MGEILGPLEDQQEGQLVDQQVDHSLITTLITMDGLHSQDKLHTLTTLIVSSHQEILEEETATSLSMEVSLEDFWVEITPLN